MSTERDPERLIHAFLMEGQTELADQVFDTVRATIERKRQRVVIGPWRLPTMNRIVPIGVGAAAVVVALIAGTQLLGSPASSGAGPTPSAVASPTAPATPTPSVAVSSAADIPPPPLTETFASARHGITFSYPSGWVARPATQPWKLGVPDYMSDAGDVVSDPVRKGDLWISVASQPLGASTPDAWVAKQIAWDDGCKTTEPTTVDGAAGLIGTDDCTRAAVTIDGRGYFIWLYTSGVDRPIQAYDRAWFEGVLATMHLQPKQAVDSASS